MAVWPADEVRRNFQRELEQELLAFFTEAYPKAEVRVILEEDGTELSVRVKIDTPQGLMSIAVVRDFRNLERGEVYHSLFAMSEGLQGKGVSPYIQRKFLEYYDKIGVTRIRTDANLDVGGYTWARYGFRPKNVIDAYGRLGFPEISEEDMWALWDKRLADGSLKEELLGSNYMAELDLSDPARRAHYEAYIRKVGAKSALYKSVFKDAPDPVKGTANEQLRDALTRHQVGLVRVSSTLGRRAQALLNATERDLSELIKRRVDRLIGTDLTTTASLERLKALDAEVRYIRVEAQGQVYALWREELRAVAEHETAYTAAAVATAAPVVLDLVRVLPSYLKTLVDTHPFEGRVLKAWSDKIAAADIDRITSQIRIGLLQGETSQQIAARVIGSAAMRGADGVTEIARRDAMALSRTAVNAFANEARRAFSEANSDIADQELFLSTLDGRTTPVCRSLDGNTYPFGEGPRPPMHFQCRSLRVLLLNGVALGSRPMKSSTEQQLVREYRRAEGLGTGPASRAGLPHGHKGSFDTFARRRVRELTGTTPATTTYQQFLSRQSAEFQDDVLGRTKGALFRRGGLTVDRFVDDQGRELTLAQLARSERAAFERAGLDPGRWG